MSLFLANCGTSKPAGGGGGGAGPMPTFVAAGNAAAAGAGSGAQPTIPAGTTTDDIMVMIVESVAGDAVTVSGWTVKAALDSADASCRMTLLWKRAGASESTPTTSNASNHIVAIIISVRGCVNTGDPWDATQTTAAAASGGGVGTLTGVTTTGANRFVVGAVSTNDDTTTVSSWAAASLASVAERGFGQTNIGNDGFVSIATGEKATAGATGTFTFNTVASTQFAGFVGALKP